MLLAPLSLPAAVPSHLPPARHALRRIGPRSRRAAAAGAGSAAAWLPNLLLLWLCAGLASAALAPGLLWSRGGGWSAAFWLIGAPLFDLAWLARARLARCGVAAMSALRRRVRGRNAAVRLPRQPRMRPGRAAAAAARHLERPLPANDHSA